VAFDAFVDSRVCASPERRGWHNTVSVSSPPTSAVETSEGPAKVSEQTVPHMSSDITNRQYCLAVFEGVPFFVVEVIGMQLRLIE
jgi:hypothetical protein